MSDLERLGPAMVDQESALWQYFSKGRRVLPPGESENSTTGVPAAALTQTGQSEEPAKPRKPTLPPLSFERFRRARPLEPMGAVALPAPYVSQEETCPICLGRGFLRVDVPYGHPAFGKPRPCQCTLRRRATALFGDAHIPEEMSDFSFESYLQQPLAEEQRQVAMQVQGFLLPRLATYEGRKRGLYLYGLWGRGKTGLAIAALRGAIAAGKSGLYLSTAELFKMLYEAIAASQRLARGYGDQEDRVEEAAGTKVLRLVESVEWLVLDDLGVECASSFVINHLYQIVEGRRLRRDCYTVFTGNKDAQGLAQHWRSRSGGTFDDGERIMQRLGESCVVVPLVGRNLRER
jgi:DNA replication protein DnaC